MNKYLSKKKIIFGILILGIVFLLDFAISRKIIQYLTQYLNNINIKIITIIPYEYIAEILKLSFISFLIVLLPFVLFLLYKNFQDALFEKEKELLKYIPKIILFAVIGLIFGGIMGLSIFLPYLSVYQAGSGIGNMRTLHSVVNFIVRVSSGCALLSQMPFLIFGLVKYKLVKLSRFTSKRKIIFIILLIVSAIVSPPDPLSMFIMIMPIYGLYEISLFFIKRKVNKSI